MHRQLWILTLQISDIINGKKKKSFKVLYKHKALLLLLEFTTPPRKKNDFNDVH